MGLSQRPTKEMRLKPLLQALHAGQPAETPVERANQQQEMQQGFREKSLHDPGVYQIGELQARSWMVAGTLVSGGIFSRTAS